MSLKIYFLIFLLIIRKTFAVSKGKCEFEETSKTIFCNGITFAQLPSYPNTKLRIHIAHSNFSTISTSSFNQYKNQHLETLSLNYNKIKYISPGAFSTLNLTRLVLHGNELGVIPKDAFNKELKELILSENHIPHIDSHALTLDKLTVLDLDHNLIKTIEREAFQLPKLNKLYLMFNKISSVGKDVFLGVPKLKELYLNYNKISSIGKDVFLGLPKLKELHLSYNKISSIDKDAFLGLHSLLRLSLSSNNIQELVPGVFRDLGSLQSLGLSNNKIEKILEGTFDNLNNLRTLSLSRNKLRTLESYYFKSLSNLNYLDLDCNLIEKVAQDTFKLPKLIHINLAGNNISHIDKAFMGIHLEEPAPGQFRNFTPSNGIFSVPSVNKLKK